MRPAMLLLILLVLLGEASSFGVLQPFTSFTRTSSTSTTTSCCRSLPLLYMTSSSSTSKEDDNTGTAIEAQDGEALQVLFSKQCDKDGLMTKEMLQAVPFIQDLLDDEDLMPQELNDIWEAAPKFPTDEDRIDVDSFVQIYRDIDDLFEEDMEESVVVVNEKEKQQEQKTTTPVPQQETEEEQELESTFKVLCDEKGLLSKQQLMEWDEIQSMMEQGLLGLDEFEAIWDGTPKSSNQCLDEQGFLSFNMALDDLFVFEEEEDVEVKTRKTTMDMVEGEDMPPGVLFAALANEDYLVGMPELERWGDLQEMLADESLLPLELQNMFDAIPKKNDNLLDEAGFIALYEAIDSLFEEVDDDDNVEESAAAEPPKASNEAKNELLSMLAEINSDTERLPCGLECTEREEKRVMNIVNELERSPSNVVQLKQGNVELTDMAGSWELLYSSSSAMKFNKGLSGLGGSIPNGKFAGLVQKLTASKYMTDVEYVERIEVNPSSASFDVLVTGDWDLRTSVSLFTGAPSTVMTVEPARVMYGPTSTKADHWKSLGPMNMLDVTYLDDDLRVMRGNTATDAIFVFRRTSL